MDESKYIPVLCVPMFVNTLMNSHSGKKKKLNPQKHGEIIEIYIFLIYVSQVGILGLQACM